MRFKRFLPKILLILLILALFLIIKYQNTIKDIWLFNLEKFKTWFDNFFYFTSSEPKRRSPISLLKKETELKLYVGEPFRSFSRQQWQEFWHIIYAAFPKEPPEREGLPKRMRQLTLDEIAFKLMSLYPQPFAYFKEEHWKLFFNILLAR